MKAKEEEYTLVRSLDGRDEALLPYLPYLLQDLWSIGTDPEQVAALVRTHLGLDLAGLKVADLGCGKGAVSVHLARELGLQVLGVDGMPAFIQEAQTHAQHYGVADRCTFRVGDIRQEVQTLRGFQVAILGAIGPVFGLMEATLQAVGPILVSGGYVIIDDAYTGDQATFSDPRCQQRAQVVEAIARHGYRIVEEIEAHSSVEEEQEMLGPIRRRAQELAQQHPDQADLFMGYVRNQEEEIDLLVHQFHCVVWMLQKP